ncbi:AraC-like DNA-binding protein [Rhizobium sp. BK313]|uniref:AraC family transcriptional regulator n=1 Tax=Rhizobium sp. BK313 TaxID=2587081 RepID=UPI00105F0D64|nr:AraC family transcriptional regulator [Rhizobium sp. BK313]MBB3458988.1 AraC-like DNA-binding protein [Rhizobium sp. BK313]
MIDLPENLTIYPDTNVREALSTDLLSHVLAQIRLTGDKLYSRTLQVRQAAELEAGTAQVVIVTQGALTLEGDQGTQLVLETGGLLLLPHGPADLRLVPDNAPAAFVACHFWFDPDSLRGMLLALPPWIYIRRSEAAGWIEGIIQFLMIEADDLQPGAALMISRLIDLVVIRTLRTWVQQGQTAGWLGGLVDTRVARAVKAIHERPSQRWRIKDLAEIAGMSKSSFCDRFTRLVGRSPLRYHNEWRLALARDLLVKGDMRVGQIGLNIGYESEAAFSRAYKALFGHPPHAERRLRNGPQRSFG